MHLGTSDLWLRLRAGGNVYTQSAFLCLGVALTTFGLKYLLTRWIRDPTLRWATAFSLIQILATLAIVIYLLARRAYSRFQKNIYDQIRPAIQERVMALALTGEGWSTAVPKHGLARQVLEQCLALALSGLKDSARDRLAQFALDQGFARQWQQAYSTGSIGERKRALSLLGLVSKIGGDTLIRFALLDPQPSIRAEAARALLVVGDARTVDQVFRSVLTESLLLRVLLTGHLKRHARYLLAHTIPSVLVENRHPETRNCLEILTIWRLAVPLLDGARLLEQHKDRFVLPIVVALLPYVTVDDTIADQLLAALASADLEVQCAAARAAGQLKLACLMPELARLLNQNTRLAVASATAMAQMGTPGERNLTIIVSGTDRKAAAAAMEALQTLTVGTP